jgi:hypothetical protein
MTEIGEVGVRKRRSSQEIKRLVTEFETSELRQSEFCQKHRLALSIIAAWVEKAPEVGVQSEGNRLVEVKVRSPLLASRAARSPIRLVESLCKLAQKSLISTFVRLIFKVSDSISSKLDALSREPIETDLRVANESFALEIQNDDEGRFRERQLLFALHQFERAWALLQGRTHQNDLRIVVRLMQGLCAAEIAGGASYALPRLRESRDKNAAEAYQTRENIRLMRQS